jgi:hypothetical protein
MLLETFRDKCLESQAVHKYSVVMGCACRGFALGPQRGKSLNMLENIHHKSTFVSELTTLSNELKEKNKEENK